jgi:hypothetical protein
VVFLLLDVSNGFFALLHAMYLLLIHLLPWVVGSRVVGSTLRPCLPSPLSLLIVHCL